MCGRPWAVRQDKAVEGEAVQGKPCILVLEDNEWLRTVVGRLLTEWGYRAIPFDNGPEALWYLEKSCAPDLAILDYALPEMNGAEFLQRAHRLFFFPAVFVTGKPVEAVEQEIRTRGLKVLGVYSKPLASEELRNVLDQHTRYEEVVEKIHTQRVRLNLLLNDDADRGEPSC